MYARFALEGPTEAEMAVARRQMARLVDEELQRPEFWAGRLAPLDYRGLSLADLLDARREYERLSAQAVRDAFRRYYAPDARFTVVVAPRAIDGGPTTG